MGKHHHHHHHDVHHDHHENADIRKNINRLMERYHREEPIIGPNPYFTMEQAFQVAQVLGMDFGRCRFDAEQFRTGMDVELEHGLVNPLTNITNNDALLTGKITLAHLNEYPDYYRRLLKMEAEAEKYWRRRRGHRRNL